MRHLVSYPDERGQSSGKPNRCFDLRENDDYLAWRTEKLAGYPETVDDLRVAIADLNAVTPAETEQITALCRKANMAIYQTKTLPVDQLRPALGRFATHFGLCRSEAHRSAEADGLVPIEVATKGGRHGFIPYTDKPLSWHTDGYYNKPADRIRAVLMHCARPAAQGGANHLFDPEIAYIRLRDENPDYIKALSHRRAMTIPGFVDQDGSFREEAPGPVFSVDRFTGALQMRYSARKRNIVWRQDSLTTEAVAFLNHVLEHDPLVFKVNLQAGEGLICNNVLHNRTAFTDHTEPGKTRLLFRARYKDRVLNT